jgi:hypothetical protein
MTTQPRTSNVIHFNLPSLVVFSAGLVFTGGTLVLTAPQFHATGSRAAARVEAPARADQGNAERHSKSFKGPWGELLVREIELERPQEYIAFDGEPRTETWTFASGPDQVRALMQRSGVNPAQIERALSPKMTATIADGTVITPDDELITSLTPHSREQLYRALGQDRRNAYMRDPFKLRPGDVQRWFANTSLDRSIVELVEKLLYPRGEVINFSDYEMVLQHIPRDSDRVLFAKTMSRQHALLLRLHVDQQTDIDKMLGYWATEGVHPKDLRPLLEALKRVPEGGSVSIAFALPPFARARLYTFPEPSEDPNSPVIDCHWSTLNFFRETPDDRFADPNYGVAYIRDNFYEISKPNMYGDRIFLVNDKGGAVHSAVYIAADIVFTKNGQGFAQPWMMMHLDDMMRMYGSVDHVRMVVYREKSR